LQAREVELEGQDLESGGDDVLLQAVFLPGRRQDDRRPAVARRVNIEANGPEPSNEYMSVDLCTK
jgi:hypothetical protein